MREVAIHREVVSAYKVFVLIIRSTRAVTARGGDEFCEALDVSLLGLSVVAFQ